MNTITRPICCLVFLLVVASAQAYAENLVRNPNFALAPGKPGAVEGWTVTPANNWQRKEIVAFRGQPFEMTYLQCDGRGDLVQKDIAVEPNTWYVLTTWYRGVYDETPPTGNFWLHLGDPAKESLSTARIGGRVLGASDDWVHVRAFVHTGEHKTVQFQTRF